MFPASLAEAQEAEQDAVREEQRLEARPQLGHDVSAQPLPKRPGRTETTMVLMEACLVVLRGRSTQPEAARIHQPALVRLWRVEQALARIRQMLGEDPKGREIVHFVPALGRRQGAGVDRLRQVRGALAGTFVACLELARQGKIEAEQGAMFDTMRVRLPQMGRCSRSYR